MKKSNHFKMGLTALAVALLAGSATFAQTSGSGSDSGSDSGSGSGTTTTTTGKRRQANFSLADFNAFMTKFFDVPSSFPWDEPSLPQYSPAPARPDSAVSMGPIVPTPAPPPDYSCLVLGSDGSSAPVSTSLYNHTTCFVDQPPVPILGQAAMAFDGTYCEAADYKIQAYWSGGSAPLQASLPAGAVGATQTLPCVSLLNLNTGSTFFVNNIAGDVRYVCRGGLWRLTSISCSDSGALCPAVSLPLTAAGRTIYRPTSVAKSGTPGPAVSCPEFGDVPGYTWGGTGIQTACVGGAWQVTVSSCTLTPIPPPPPPPPVRNVTYPNCTGADTAYADPYLKAGIKACLNGAQTKYLWMMIDGDAAPTVCADSVNGC